MYKSYRAIEGSTRKYIRNWIRMGSRHTEYWKIGRSEDRNIKISEDRKSVSMCDIVSKREITYIQNIWQRICIRMYIRIRPYIQPMW